MELDIPRINLSKPKELVKYFNELRSNAFTDSIICQALFEAANAELLAQRVLTTFLTWSNTPKTLAAYVKHGPDRPTRRLGTRLFGKRLAEAGEWESVWMAFGGVRGLVALFASAPIGELKLLCHAIGHGCGRVEEIEDRQLAVEELLEALLPRNYPHSESSSKDERPILHLYAWMLPACSADFVDDVLTDQDLSNPLYLFCDYSRVTEVHSAIARDHVESEFFDTIGMDEDYHRPLETFLRRDLAFAMQIIQFQLDRQDNVAWPPIASEYDILLLHLNRLLKKRSSSDSAIRSTISLALRLVQTKGHDITKKSNLWTIVCMRWWKQPELNESLFVASLRLDLGGPQEKIGRGYFKASDGSDYPKPWSWPLLRLYCLHVLENGIDLETATDFLPLAKQRWCAEMFFEIPKEQAIRILSGLHKANPEFNFLEPPQTSILQFKEIQSMARKNFNVDLLMTMLQSNSERVLDQARTAVDKLRESASTSRDQSYRAEVAKAASAYAIASGNHELYHETIVWQQRFVRDPLTIKTIFSKEAVESDEGIDFLSGIPDKLPADTTSTDEIITRIEKGNKIILAFHETMALAKREPSFQKKDWESITSLTSEVFKRRITRAEKLLTQEMGDKKGEVFRLVWQSTLTLLNELQEELMSIKTLFAKLSPQCLASATKLMIETGDQRRKLRNRQPEDDYIDQLSYTALRKLASSDKPELAKELILRTVLERPDASAWHRQLLSRGFMRRLSAEDSRSILLELASSIGEKLEEQSYVRVGDATPQKSKPPESIVKVTTAKYLAQLLKNAPYISANATTEILIELFKVATHRDIRLVTLDSLLNSLDTICDESGEMLQSNPLVERIFEALEMAIPVAGGINERYPPRDEDWQEAIEKNVLPKIADTSTEPPPLLLALIKSINRLSHLKKLRSEFLTRLVVPILETSLAEHQRWVSHFTTKYNVTSYSVSVPNTPVTPLVWDAILIRYSDLLPQGVFEDFYKHIMTTVAPPSGLRSFNKSLESNTNLRNETEVKHWLQIYGQDADNFAASGLKRLLDVMDHVFQHGGPFDRLLEMVFSVICAILDNYERYNFLWTEFVFYLRHPWDSEALERAKVLGKASKDHQAWEDARRPLIRKLAAHLLDKKQKKPMHQTQVTRLPLALELQLLLLPYPRSRDRIEAESERKRFSVELENLLIFSLQNEVDVLQWRKAGTATCYILKLMVPVKEKLQLAVYIGQFEAGEVSARANASAQLKSALNMIRIRVVTTLIEEGWDFMGKDDRDELILKEKERLAQMLKSMLQEWQRSDDDLVVDELMEWKSGKDKIWSTLMDH